MERNTLMEYVYPKMKEYCREKHGLEFQVGLGNEFAAETCNSNHEACNVYMLDELLSGG